MRPWCDVLGTELAATIVEVKDAAWVPGCTLSFDAVAYIADAAS
jgi:hypothetical protein